MNDTRNIDFCASKGEKHKETAWTICCSISRWFNNEAFCCHCCDEYASNLFFSFFWRLLHSARVRFAISLDRLLAHMKTFFSFIFFFTFFKSLWSVLNLITNQIFIQNVLERPPTHKLPQIIPLLINLFPNKWILTMGINLMVSDGFLIRSSISFTLAGT